MREAFGRNTGSPLDSLSPLSWLAVQQRSTVLMKTTNGASPSVTAPRLAGSSRDPELRWRPSASTWRASVRRHYRGTMSSSTSVCERFDPLKRCVDCAIVYVRSLRYLTLPPGLSPLQEFTETMACPVCHSTKAKIHTMGFYQCKYDWWGRVAREDATDHGRVSGKGRAADGKYHLFTGTKVSGTGSKAKVTGETSEYRVLVVRATPLS